MVDTMNFTKVFLFLGSVALLTMVVPISQLNAALEANNELGQTLAGLLKEVERATTCATDLSGTAAIAEELRRAHPEVVEAIRTMHADNQKGAALTLGSGKAVAAMATLEDSALLNFPADDEAAETALRKSHPALVSALQQAWAPYVPHLTAPCSTSTTAARHVHLLANATRIPSVRYRYTNIWRDRQIVTKEQKGISVRTSTTLPTLFFYTYDILLTWTDTLTLALY
jgi:ABC-type transporter Mla subunit MlaD